ncbi:MAG: aspartate/glutamate racemase family protein [Syntrophaceae bacterium]|nr:aspartate/glutamate racemase family protein [Syntrophaceae bacterium]
MSLEDFAKQVALVSSTRAVFGPMEAAFREVFPEAQIFHILDETLIEDFRREAGLSPDSRQKALRMALTAQEAGVDGILVTCSTLSPAVDDLRPFLKIPIVKIDEPVIEEVVQKADTVGLLATAETVLKSVEPLVMKKAKDLGRKISISRFTKSDVWPLLQKDPEAFYRAIAGAASEAAHKCGAVILTQVSIAPGRDYVEEKLRNKIYASPTYAVQVLRKILLKEA